MKTAGRPRRELLVRFALEGPEPRVDVGADHGWVARALGCIATEREHHRIANNDQLTWVVSDGLDAFGPLGTAVIAGMGAKSIARIVDRAPPVQRLVLHAQDTPPVLREHLATTGWRIVAEGLAAEAGRFAEVIVVEPGQETHTGLTLHFGPYLLTGVDPQAKAHFTQVAAWLGQLVEHSARAPDTQSMFKERLAFVEAWLAAW